MFAFVWIAKIFSFFVWKQAALISRFISPYPIPQPPGILKCSKAHALHFCYSFNFQSGLWLAMMVIKFYNFRINIYSNFLLTLGWPRLVSRRVFPKVYQPHSLYIPLGWFFHGMYLILGISSCFKYFGILQEDYRYISIPNKGEGGGGWKF